MRKPARPQDDRLTTALTAAVVSGSATDQARLTTVARACATACLRVADAELGRAADEEIRPPGSHFLTNTNSGPVASEMPEEVGSP